MMGHKLMLVNMPVDVCSIDGNLLVAECRSGRWDLQYCVNVQYYT